MSDERFEIVLADTPEAKRIHYRIRFLVYCLETGFEDPGAHPDGLERDGWDDDAAHFLVRSRDSGDWIAAMRLVLPGPRRLPVETVCNLDPDIVDSAPADRVGEVSRLCMIDRYRRRSQERDFPYEVVDADAGRRRFSIPPPVERRAHQRRHGSEIMLSLLVAAAEYSRGVGLAHWLFLTSPVLCKVIERYGVSLIPAGEPCLYRGERRPYFVDLLRASNALRSGDARAATWFDEGRQVRTFSELTRHEGARRDLQGPLPQLMPVA